MSRSLLAGPRRRPAFFAALLPYLSGKRLLAPLILALLQEFLPRERWRDSLFLDPFCGGCAVALYAKAAGFRVVACTGDAGERKRAARPSAQGRALRREARASLPREPRQPGHPPAFPGHATCLR